MQVVVAAGSLRSQAATAITFPHAWTREGVTVESDFTGAHLLHLAAAGCVLNDIYREAHPRGLQLDGVRVRAFGGFDPETWQSTGIEYQVELDSAEAPEALDQLLRTVDAVAEVPKAIRLGAEVRRT